MNSLITFVVVVALLGSALIGGTFFAFSSFVIKALARVPSPAGIAAMQSINIVVINPSFLGAFLGTALLSLVITGLTLADSYHPSAMFYLGGSVFYLLGTFLVTMLFNVPLNNQLAVSSASDPGASGVWEHYLERWTTWNHVRTMAAMAAVLLFSLGIMLDGGM